MSGLIPNAICVDPNFTFSKKAWKLSAAPILGVGLTMFTPIAGAHPPRITRVELMETSSFGRTQYRDFSRALFNQLADRWERETAASSLLRRKFAHPRFRQIRAMGKRAYPYILQRMQASPGHWPFVLLELVGSDAIKDHDINDVDSMVDAWMAWGKKHGIR